MASDQTFAWWGENGEKHEGPIRFVTLPPGYVLTEIDRCVPMKPKETDMAKSRKGKKGGKKC